MAKLFPSPTDLCENPELASLWTLKTNLEVAQQVLLATYPDDAYSERCYTEQEAYATGILYQIDALVVMLHEYTQSARRLQHSWLDREPTKPPSSCDQPPDDDIPF